jgi:hypothetical protein
MIRPKVVTSPIRTRVVKKAKEEENMKVGDGGIL